MENAMENDPFIDSDVLPMKMVMFHSYVSLLCLLEGNPSNHEHVIPLTQSHVPKSPFWIGQVPWLLCLRAWLVVKSQFFFKLVAHWSPINDQPVNPSFFVDETPNFSGATPSKMYRRTTGTDPAPRPPCSQSPRHPRGTCRRCRPPNSRVGSSVVGRLNV